MHPKLHNSTTAHVSCRAAAVHQAGPSRTHKWWWFVQPATWCSSAPQWWRWLSAAAGADAVGMVSIRHATPAASCKPATCTASALAGTQVRPSSGCRAMLYFQKGHHCCSPQQGVCVYAGKHGSAPLLCLLCACLQHGCAGGAQHVEGRLGGGLASKRGHTLHLCIALDCGWRKGPLRFTGQLCAAHTCAGRREGCRAPEQGQPASTLHSWSP